MTLSLLLAGGCVAAPRPSSVDQVATQVQAGEKKAKLQEQLMTQISRTTLASYQDYEVGPEDLLEVAFFGQEDLNREVRVNGRGEATLPLVGVIKVSGLSPLKIEDLVKQAYKEGRFIKNPQITVTVKEYRHQRVMVSGGVVQPGSYEVIGPRTLLEMLGKAGGLNDKAADVVHVIRFQNAPERTKALQAAGGVQPFSPGSQTIVIDLRRLLLHGAMELNLPIKNGDVIYVPLAQNAYVLGAVNKAGNVPVKENLTATQAVAIVGGVNPVLANDDVSVVRFDDQGQRLILSTNLGKVANGTAADIPLKDNDIVYVHESGMRRFFFDFKNMFPGSLGATIPFF